MVDHWISAAVARSLVINPPSEIAETVALCERAHAGLVRAKARLLLEGDVRRENALLPSRFWWAEGHEALKQDWARGDFSTWIEQRVHWRAFDVSFALDGVLEILPAERRAAAARSVSVVGDPAWLTSNEARRVAYETGNANPMNPGQIVLDHARLGFVTARAVLMQLSSARRPDDWQQEEREWDVPNWFWENFTSADSSSQQWDRGIFAGKGRAPDGLCWITLSGVHFLAESLDVLLPRAGRAPSAPALQPNPGGRPRKEWWDDLWCAMWGRVHRGDFNPKRQAEIERAMLEWAEQHGHSVAESVVRPLARKMMETMRSEAENP